MFGLPAFNFEISTLLVAAAGAGATHVVRVFGGILFGREAMGFGDVVLVAILFYRLLILVRGTRAAQMFVGLLVLVVVSLLARWFHLATVDYLATSLRTVWLMLWRVSSISANGMLLRQRTVALLTLARSEPRGSVFLKM